MELGTESKYKGVRYPRNGGLNICERLTKTCKINGSCRIFRSTDGGRISKILRNDQILFRETKCVTYCLGHAGITGDTATEDNRFAHREILNDDGLVIADHGITETIQNIWNRNALLLAVDDICLGKDRASPGKTGNGSGFFHFPGIVFNPHSKAGHLIFKERAGTAGTVSADAETGSRGVQISNKARTLTANFHNTSSVGNKGPNSLRYGGDFVRQTGLG